MVADCEANDIVQRTFLQCNLLYY